MNRGSYNVGAASLARRSLAKEAVPRLIRFCYVKQEQTEGTESRSRLISLIFVASCSKNTSQNASREGRFTNRSKQRKQKID